MKILPWLSAKSWSDISAGDRARLAKQWFGVEIPYGLSQDGSPAAPLVYDDAVLAAGSQYTMRYLERYSNAALVQVRWKGAVRPVVNLSVESAWIGGFDARSAKLFREWLAAKHGEIGKLNARWGTALKSFDAVEPRDVKLFDYSGARGRTCSPSGGGRGPRGVSRGKRRRSRWLGWQPSCARAAPTSSFSPRFPTSTTPSTRMPRTIASPTGPNPESCDYADIVLFRCTGPLTASEAQSLQRHRRRTGATVRAHVPHLLRLGRRPRGPMRSGSA